MSIGDKYRNKYRDKIIKFFEINGFDFGTESNDDFFDGPFINHIKNTFEISFMDIPKIESIRLGKINDGKTPLLYDALRDDDQSISEFNDWYRKSNSLEIKKMITDPSMRDILFNPIDERKKLHNMFYDNYFMPLDVIYCGEINDLDYDFYSGDGIDISIYSIDGDKPDVKLILKIINFFRRLKQKMNKKLDLIIFYCNQKKYFPKNKGDTITPENINSGCSFTNNYIYLWRKEEFYKVLIHELIHYFHLDFHDKDPNDLNDSFTNMIKVQGRDVINEAYTEFLAVLLNCIVIGSISNNTKTRSITQLIESEILFTHLQIAKIINHFDANSLENLVIIQNTSLASYVIVKGILLNNYKLMIPYLNSMVHDDRIIWNSQYDNYCILYRKLMNTNSLNNELIKKILKIIQNTKKSFVTETLRMTLNG